MPEHESNAQTMRQVWVVETSDASEHPDPCGHSPEISCLNTYTRHPLHIFETREQARSWSTETYSIEQDEWIYGEPGENFDVVVRDTVDGTKIVHEFVLSIRTATMHEDSIVEAGDDLVHAILTADRVTKVVIEAIDNWRSARGH